MKMLLLNILFPLGIFAQQTIELCGGPTTFTYSTFATSGNITQWGLNNQTYYGDQVTLTWTEPGVYSLSAIRVTDDCPSEPVFYTVTVMDCEQFFVPNAFTPDGGEFNNDWGPVFADPNSLAYFQLLVFNRWGEIIWESLDPNARWDGAYKGDVAQDGVYTWKLTYGFNKDEYKEVVNGHVNILR
jgi:gliding motility-associated-like protein